MSSASNTQWHAGGGATSQALTSDHTHAVECRPSSGLGNAPDPFVAVWVFLHSPVFTKGSGGLACPMPVGHIGFHTVGLEQPASSPRQACEKTFWLRQGRGFLEQRLGAQKSCVM